MMGMTTPASKSPVTDVLTLAKTALITTGLGAAAGVGLATWLASTWESDRLAIGIFAVLFASVLGAIVGGVSGFVTLFLARPIAAKASATTARILVATIFAAAGLVLLTLLALNSLSTPYLVGLLACAIVLFAVGYWYLAPRLVSEKSPSSEQ